jgi:hypothetical protein
MEQSNAMEYGSRKVSPGVLKLRNKCLIKERLGGRPSGTGLLDER